MWLFFYNTVYSGAIAGFQCLWRFLGNFQLIWGGFKDPSWGFTSLLIQFFFFFLPGKRFFRFKVLECVEGNQEMLRRKVMEAVLAVLEEVRGGFWGYPRDHWGTAVRCDGSDEQRCRGNCIVFLLGLGSAEEDGMSFSLA